MNRKDFEGETLRLIELVIQNPQQYQAFFDEWHRRWMAQLKAREEWARELPETRAYQVMVNLLCTARDIKHDPIMQQIFALCAMIEFLDESNFPSALIKPLRNLRGELLDRHATKRLQGKPGARPMQHNAAAEATLAAAAVTALSKEMSVGDALKLISKAAHIDMTWLRQFRQNLQRGIGAHAFSYRAFTMTFEGKSSEQILGLFRSAP